MESWSWSWRRALTDAVGTAEESRKCLSGEAATTAAVLSAIPIADTSTTSVVVVLVGHLVWCDFGEMMCEGCVMCLMSLYGRQSGYRGIKNCMLS